jgi:hypothetical protein
MCTLCIVVVGVALLGNIAHASWNMRMVIGDSGPSRPSNITITFTAEDEIPGASFLRFSSPSGWVMPSNATYLDVDMYDDSASLPLSSIATLLESGVQVSSSGFVVTLGSLVRIAAGSTVTLQFGTHASEGGAGRHSLTTSPSPGRSAATLSIERSDSSVLVSRSMWTVILEHVTVSATVPSTPENSRLHQGRSTAGLTSRPLSPFLKEGALSAEQRSRDGRDARPIVGHDLGAPLEHFIILRDIIFRANPALCALRGRGACASVMDWSGDLSGDGKETFRDMSIFLSRWDVGSSTVGH